MLLLGEPVRYFQKGTDRMSAKITLADVREAPSNPPRAQENEEAEEGILPPLLELEHPFTPARTALLVLRPSDWAASHR